MAKVSRARQVSRAPQASRVLRGFVLVAAGVMALSACSSTVEGTAISSSQGTVPATRATPTPDSTTNPAPPTRPRPDEGGDVDISVEIGQCVNLGGTVDAAEIDNAQCGSMSANYVVIGKEPTRDLCPGDADQTYYETLRGVEQGALCLDIDWRINDCFDLGNDDPQRKDCSATMTKGVKVREIVSNADAVDSCTLTTTGYVYDERRFVVCVDDLGTGS